MPQRGIGSKADRANGAMASGAPLTDDAIRKYGASRNFLPSEEEDQGNVVVTAIDFHRQGDLCVAARNDGVLQLINCLSGTISKTIFTRRYGVELAKFTHHPDCVIFSSLNEVNDHRIRYHSFFDNTFLRYYIGHTGRVTSLMMHPTSDEFMSASLDGTVRLWDIRSSECSAQIRMDHMPVAQVCASYDQEGVVFGVYSDDHLIRMYDARNYQEGPFAKFSLYDQSILTAMNPFLAELKMPSLEAKRLHALDIKFSPDGNSLLVPTNRGAFLQLDAFEGQLMHLLTQHVQPQFQGEAKLGCCYSPDGAYVTTGSEDGRIFIYRMATGELVHTFPQGHAGPILDLQWNPQRHLLASAGGNSTVLWTTA